MLSGRYILREKAISADSLKDPSFRPVNSGLTECESEQSGFVMEEHDEYKMGCE